MVVVRFGMRMLKVLENDVRPSRTSHQGLIGEITSWARAHTIAAPPQMMTDTEKPTRGRGHR